MDSNKPSGVLKAAALMPEGVWAICTLLATLEKGRLSVLRTVVVRNAAQRISALCLGVPTGLVIPMSLVLPVVLVRPVVNCTPGTSVVGNSAVPPVIGSVTLTWRSLGGAGCSSRATEDSMVMPSAPRVGSYSNRKPIWRVS